MLHVLVFAAIASTGNVAIMNKNDALCVQPLGHICSLRLTAM